MGQNPIRELQARVDISGGIQASLAGRYAIALFELARDEKQLEAVGASLATLRQALAESDDLRALTDQPADRPRRRRCRRVAAAAGGDAARSAHRPTSSACSPRTAGSRQLGDVIRAFNLLAASHRGEITAEVTSAHPLDDDQVDALKHNLKHPHRPRRRRRSRASIPPSWAASSSRSARQMIDGSIRTKLNTLAQAMKG